VRTPGFISNIIGTTNRRGENKMTTKWWKTGLLVVTLLLLIGIASAQAVPARLVDGWDGRTRDTNGNPVPLDGLPGSL
jgi:hypothetical protein